MGTRVAPSYANLFMGLLEKKILNECPENLKKKTYFTLEKIYRRYSHYLGRLMGTFSRIFQLYQ